MTHDDAGLSAALHERVQHEDPDLDQLIQVSTRTGTRLRRRRTAGLSIAGVAAGVTVIGIVGASLGGAGGQTGSEPGFASQPTAAASPSAPAPGTLDDPDRSRSDQPRAQQLPVHVARSLQGWEIGIAADEKFPASRGDYFVTVVVRPMSEYASWSGGDSDHPASQVVHVGGNYFVTAQPTPNVPQDVLDELVSALRYKPTWRK